MTNARFEELEKRAKKLQNIKIAKIFIFLMLLITLCGGIFYLFFDVKSNIVQQVNTQKDPIETIQAQINITKEMPKEVLPKEVLQEEVKTIAPQKHNNTYETIELSLILPQEFVQEKEKIQKDRVVEKTQVIAEQKPADFSLHVRLSDKKEVLLRDFQANNSYETAIELAQYFYEQSSYAQAVYWSKQASRLDPNVSPPWILYAQSKIQLGNKDDAIKALENYLEFFNSKEVANLLAQIRNKGE
ncbi:MAG: tetratricopeptide repeat protein [Sulfurospirillum sp.]|nr:tetratricopeptide repeat protein [Sulfurospirillum sp.]